MNNVARVGSAIAGCKRSAVPLGELTTLRLGGPARGLVDAAHADQIVATAAATDAAGEPWDDVVARCATEGLAGLECLSAIPGSTGATPIQNVGAYGPQVADTIVAVPAYDRVGQQVIHLTPAQCEFGYRSSDLDCTLQGTAAGSLIRRRSRSPTIARRCI